MSRASPERTALFITLLYLGAGVLWVLFSDHLLLSFVNSARAVTRLQSLKGVGFVVATASLLYPLLRQGFQKRQPRQRLRGQDDTRAWLERASEPMLVFDRAGRLLEVNSLACAAFGYGAPELLRVGTQFLVAPNDPPPVPWADLREGRPLQLDRRLQRKDGSTFQARLDVRLLHDARVLVAVRTLGDRRGSNRSAEHVAPLRLALPPAAAPAAAPNGDELTARRAQRMEALGRLAGGVAHDFNNLLTAILGYGDMARRALTEDDPTRRHVDEILKAADRGAELTRQLLAFSRHQSGESRSLSLNGVVSEVEGMLRRLIGEDVVLVTRLEAAGSRIRADRTQIDQVILNLAVNARDAMPRGGTLLIETAAVQVGEAEAWRQPEARPGSYVRLTVADTGCGMEPAVKEHAFEPFFTTKEEGKGTGLGLATVYGIVKQSGGFIVVDSEPDRGTIIQLYFPRSEDPFTAVRPDAFEIASGRGETLLVVEDELPVLELMGAVLAAAGYTVLRARRAEEALEVLAASQRVDLIVTDVVLPGIGGPELAKRASARQPGVKVLFLSGYASDGIAPLLDGPPLPFLQKPFTPDLLLRKIREVIDRSLDAGSPA